MWVVKEKRWRKSKKKGKHSRVGNSHWSSKDDYISLKHSKQEQVHSKGPRGND